MPYQRGRWPEQEIEECLLEGDTYVPAGQYYSPLRKEKKGSWWGDWLWRLGGLAILFAIGGGVAEGCDRISGNMQPVEENGSTLRASRERLKAKYSKHLGRDLTDEELTDILSGEDPDDDLRP